MQHIISLTFLLVRVNFFSTSKLIIITRNERVKARKKLLTRVLVYINLNELLLIY